MHATTPHSTAFLEAHNIAFSNPAPILKPITLGFEKSLVYGILGHNGSGKSTLIKILARQLKPTSGEVCVDSKNIESYSHKHFARKIAYLPQSLPAPMMSGFELVSMGRYAHQKFGANPQDLGIINAALKATHTEKFAAQSIATLSGGERTRLFLAMLLAQESEFLLLDEPLAPLDIAHQIEVMQLVSNLAKQRNIGVIIVIHDINLASSYCDRIIALHKGELALQEEAGALMDSALLWRLFGVESHIINHPTQPKKVAIF